MQEANRVKSRIAAEEANVSPNVEKSPSPESSDSDIFGQTTVDSEKEKQAKIIHEAVRLLESVSENQSSKAAPSQGKGSFDDRSNFSSPNNSKNSPPINIPQSQPKTPIEAPPNKMLSPKKYNQPISPLPKQSRSSAHHNASVQEAKNPSSEHKNYRSPSPKPRETQHDASKSNSTNNSISKIKEQSNSVQDLPIEKHRGSIPESHKKDDIKRPRSASASQPPSTAQSRPISLRVLSLIHI
eukprot:TRINITY_DN2082_c0_g1_i1.p1 TRINITY_DN2082_c0_g1~~TRINITY_DN2082_c0_g1_i1.p1  ORF type:complete len:241 (-),score=58.84 TRINITY_DN2082_c0_g1_i1:23-745(-)